MLFAVVSGLRHRAGHPGRHEAHSGLRISRGAPWKAPVAPGLSSLSGKERGPVPGLFRRVGHRAAATTMARRSAGRYSQRVGHPVSLGGECGSCDFQVGLGCFDLTGLLELLGREVATEKGGKSADIEFALALAPGFDPCGSAVHFLVLLNLLSKRGSASRPAGRANPSVHARRSSPPWTPSRNDSTHMRNRPSYLDRCIGGPDTGCPLRGAVGELRRTRPRPCDLEASEAWLPVDHHVAAGLRDGRGRPAFRPLSSMG